MMRLVLPWLGERDPSEVICRNSQTRPHIIYRKMVLALSCLPRCSRSRKQSTADGRFLASQVSKNALFHALADFASQRSSQGQWNVLLDVLERPEAEQAQNSYLRFELGKGSCISEYAINGGLSKAIDDCLSSSNTR